MDAEVPAVDGRELLHLSDVRACHKAAARAREDDHIDFLVGFHLVQSCVQIAQHLAVQGIQSLLTVNRQNPHVPLLL